VSSVAPAIRGDWTPGVDFVCGACETILVASSHASALLDVVLVCSACGRSMLSPRRRPGQPIVANSLLISPGTYNLSDTVWARKVQSIGHPALQDYGRETGARWIVGPSAAVITRLEPAELRSLASELKQLVAQHSDRELERMKRGAKNVNRVIELAVALERQALDIAKATKRKPALIDGNMLAEAISLIEVLRRWQHHPAIHRLTQSLSNPPEVQHTATLLTAASYLVDGGNGVGISDSDGLEGRVPDLWIETPFLEDVCDVEVKVPQAFRSPPGELTHDLAVRVITRQLKDAVRQFRTDNSGLVVIGGLHLGPQRFRSVVKAAREVIERDCSRRTRLVGIQLADLTYKETRWICPHPPASTSFAPVWEQELVANPAYNGGIRLNRSDTTDGPELPRPPFPPPNRAQRRRSGQRGPRR
jgi:hypothetical protein